MSNPYAVVNQFESALCEYTGAQYCVTTTSCTNALLLSLMWAKKMNPHKDYVEIPNHTYIGVAMSVVNAGFKIKFIESDWYGTYRLNPFRIMDSARWMSGDMYIPGTFTCLSFHWAKHLSIGQGGAILHDDAEADTYLRRARFDGRAQDIPAADDMTDVIGLHAYMMPRDAAEGLSKLAVLPKHNAPIPNSIYPHLPSIPAFAKHIYAEG